VEGAGVVGVKKLPSRDFDITIQGKRREEYSG
jgi:hypothetical protein